MALSREMRVSRCDQVIIAEPEPDKCIMLHLETGHYHSLNATGVFLWGVLDAPQSINSMADRLQKEFDLSDEAAISDVTQFTEDMLSRKLLNAE